MTSYLIVINEKKKHKILIYLIYNYFIHLIIYVENGSFYIPVNKLFKILYALLN